MKIAIDIRPLTDGNAVRGIGSYVRNLVPNLFEIDNRNQYGCVVELNLVNG